MDQWSNNSCLGYAIKAMENLKLDEETIKKVVSEMKYLFDVKTLEQAEEVYMKSRY